MDVGAAAVGLGAGAWPAGATREGEGHVEVDVPVGPQHLLDARDAEHPEVEERLLRRGEQRPRVARPRLDRDRRAPGPPATARAARRPSRAWSSPREEPHAPEAALRPRADGVLDPPSAAPGRPSRAHDRRRREARLAREVEHLLAVVGEGRLVEALATCSVSRSRIARQASSGSPPPSPPWQPQTHSATKASAAAR